MARRAQRTIEYDDESSETSVLGRFLLWAGLAAVAAGSADEALAAYVDERCDVLTADTSALHGMRLKTPQPANHDILPEIISKEPLGPAVR